MARTDETNEFWDGTKGAKVQQQHYGTEKEEDEDSTFYPFPSGEEMTNHPQDSLFAVPDSGHMEEQEVPSRDYNDLHESSRSQLLLLYLETIVISYLHKEKSCKANNMGEIC